MDEIKKLQIQALDRIGGFLADLEHAINAYDAESKVYIIMRCAENIHKQMHAANAVHGEIHFCEHLLKSIEPCQDPAIQAAKDVEQKLTEATSKVISDLGLQ